MSPFVSLFLSLNGSSHSSTGDPPHSCKPGVEVVNPCHFLKYSKSSPVALICFHPVGSLSYNLASMSESTLASELGPDFLPPTTEDLPEDYASYIPPKYMPWASVFSPVDVDQLPPHCPYNGNIKLEDGKSPPFGMMYWLSPDECNALSEYIESNLKKGFIHHSISSATLPILFVRKKTRDLRLCVNYRGLNAITKKNCYPLPLIDDLLNHVKGCMHFSMLDLKNAFNLIHIK